jgi:hypothetical protein
VDIQMMVVILVILILIVILILVVILILIVIQSHNTKTFLVIHATLTIPNGALI